MTPQNKNISLSRHSTVLKQPKNESKSQTQQSMPIDDFLIFFGLSQKGGMS